MDRTSPRLPFDPTGIFSQPTVIADTVGFRNFTFGNKYLRNHHAHSCKIRGKLGIQVQHFTQIVFILALSFSEDDCTECQKWTAQVRCHAISPHIQRRLSSFLPSGRSSPSGETCRYRVCRVTPSCLHRSPTQVSGCPIAAMANRSLYAFTAMV
jgi:hypothetical protein